MLNPVILSITALLYCNGKLNKSKKRSQPVNKTQRYRFYPLTTQICMKVERNDNMIIII